MRLPCVCLTFLVLAATALAQSAVRPPEPQRYQTPELHTAKTVTLSPAYGCRAKEEFQKGYESTALFLSDFVRRDNSPDLLFNGACGGEDTFDPATHGGNRSLIADLDRGASVLNSFDKYDSLSRGAMRDAGFSERAPVKAGHTYVVLIDKTRVRGVFVFTVLDYEANKHVTLSYEVQDYQIRQAGFDRINSGSQQ
jgi:hypothetical protein